MQLSFSEISGLFSVATGIYGLFILASPRLRDEYRVGLVRWLRGEQELGQNWGTTFLTVFDSAFRVVRRRIPLVGAVYLPGMLVSALSSIITVVVMSLFYLTVLMPEGTDIALSEADLERVWLFPWDVTISIDELPVMVFPLETAIVFPVLLNVVPDYLSLSETRWLIKRIGAQNSQARRILFFLLDFAATSFIAFVAYVAINTVYFGLVFGIPLSERGDKVVVYAEFYFSTLLVFLDPVKNHDAVYIYSTYLTSLWLWLFLLGGLIFQILSLIPVFVEMVNKVFVLDDIVKAKPLQLLGGLSAAAILLSGALILI